MSGRRDVSHGKPELELKAATKALIRAAGGTDGAAQTVGARQQRMSDCQCRNTADFLRVDELAALEDVAIPHDGWPHVTRALARRQGFELVRLPAAAPDCADWHTAIGALSKEAGEAVQAACKSLASQDAPGRVTAATIAANRVVEEIDDAIEKLVALKALAVCAEEGR